MIKTSGTMMATELEPISPPTLTLGTLVIEGGVVLVAIVSEVVVMAPPAQTDMPLYRR